VLGIGPLVASTILKLRDIYQVRVTVLGPDKSPVENANVTASVGGEGKKVEGGREFAIPSQIRPADGRVVFRAAVNNAFLTGASVVTLDADYYPTTTIQLAADSSAMVRGIVVDERDKPVDGATVSVTGYTASVTTDKNGNFELPAHAADGQMVQVRAQKGQLTGSTSGPAGSGTLTICETAMTCRRHPFWMTFIFLVGSFLFLITRILWAEAGVLVVEVEDVHNRPVSGVRIGVKGDGGSAISDDDGKARIRLAKDTKEESWVILQIRDSPPGKDFVILSPWDYRVSIPSFENESQNFVGVVVIERNNRVALEDGNVVALLAYKINRENAQKDITRAVPDNPESNLTAVAKQYGLSPEELNQAILAWGARAKDPFGVGQAALYARSYADASRAFGESLRQAEGTLATNQRAVSDRSYFLGVSLFEQGKYREAAVAFQRCSQFRPTDTQVLNVLALSLHYAGDYGDAERIYRHVLSVREQELGPYDPSVAISLNNLAELLKDTANYPEAEAKFRRAVEIDQDALGCDDPAVASDLSNLGVLLEEKRDYASAAPLFRCALTIDEKAFRSDDASVARDLNNLASLMHLSGDNEAAANLYWKALAINRAALGGDHPTVAINLNNIASLLQAEGDDDAAECIYGEARIILESKLGPNHPKLAKCLSNLGAVLQDEGKPLKAEPLLRRALEIDEAELPVDHPEVGADLAGLALILLDEGQYPEAELKARRALEISLKTRDPEHPLVALCKVFLARALAARGDYQNADALLQDALAIDTKALGPDHAMTRQIREALETLRSAHPILKTK
jgi:tetratricopeptide (TPR) repeat protein